MLIMENKNNNNINKLKKFEDTFKKFKKIIIFLLFVILIPVVLIMLYPYVWKVFGGTFIWGSGVVYKGKTLFDSKENCSVMVQENFRYIKRVCTDGKGNPLFVEEYRNGKKI